MVEKQKKNFCGKCNKDVTILCIKCIECEDLQLCLQVTDAVGLSYIFGKILVSASWGMADWQYETCS